MSPIVFRPYKAELIDGEGTTEQELPFELSLEEGKELVVRERTFKEEIRDRYLRGAIEWLLHFQVPERPIRAQEAGSPWQAAWSVLHFLNAKQIFQEVGKHGELIDEIDRKMLGDDSLQGAVPWLLDCAQPEGDLLHWEGLMYDTAVLSQALVTARKEYARRGLDIGLEKELRNATQRSMRWLCEKVVARHTAKDFPSDHVLSALLFVNNCYPGEYRGILEECSTKLGKDVISHLLDDMLKSTQDRIKRKDCVPEASEAFRELLSDPDRKSVYQTRIVEFLPQYIQGLEETSDAWGAPGDEASRLAAYIRATDLLKSSPGHVANPGIVLKSLHKICKEEYRFPDGSIYHDLYHTIYVTRCLIEVYQHWPEAKDPLPKLFDNLFSTASKKAKASNERVQLLAMARDYELLQTKLANSETKRKHWLWYGAIFYILYILIMLVVILPRFFSKLQPYENVTLVIAVAAILIPMVIGAIRGRGREEE